LFCIIIEHGLASSGAARKFGELFLVLAGGSIVGDATFEFGSVSIGGGIDCNLVGVGGDSMWAELWVFNKVLVEKWFQVGIQPVTSFLDICFVGDKQ